MWEYGFIQSLGPKALQAVNKAGLRSQLPLGPDVEALPETVPTAALCTSGQTTKRDDAVGNVRIPLPFHPQLTCGF